MNKKLAAALSGGAVLMLVLSGCGGDDGDKKADAWAKKVCDQWQPELKKIEAANADIKRVATESSKPEDVQKTDSAAFGTMSESYKTMGSALQGQESRRSRTVRRPWTRRFRASSRPPRAMPT